MGRSRSCHRRRSYERSRRHRHSRTPSERKCVSRTRTSRSVEKKKSSSLSNSRERSRENERRRRKMQAECIRRAGGFQKLADSEGKEPVRLFWDGFQWVAKTGHSTALQSDPALMNSTRKLRRLYFGNLPLHLGLTESLFQELVWIEMKNRGICNDPTQQPVLCVWFAKDKGNYGFVEFASVEETNRALESLDGMNCMGVSLKVSRPNDYSSVHTGFSSSLVGGADMFAAGTSSIPGAAITGTATRVVRFHNIVHEEDVGPGDTWDEFLQDVKSGCECHGNITSAVIITPDKKGDCPYSVGDVFLEFDTPEHAAACIAARSGRRYLNRPLTVMAIEDAVYSQLIKPLA